MTMIQVKAFLGGLAAAKQTLSTFSQCFVGNVKAVAPFPIGVLIPSSVSSPTGFATTGPVNAGFVASQTNAIRTKFVVMGSLGDKPASLAALRAEMLVLLSGFATLSALAHNVV